MFVFSRSGRAMTRSIIGLWVSGMGDRIVTLDCLPSMPMFGLNIGDKSWNRDGGGVGRAVRG